MAYRIVTDCAGGWFKTIEEVAAFLKFTSWIDYSKCWAELVEKKDEYTQEDVSRFLSGFETVWNRNNPDCIIVECHG